MAFKTERWTLANILPVGFVLWIIGTLWSVYFFLHLRDLLQWGRTDGKWDAAMFNRGLWQAIVSQCLTAMLLVCLFRAIVTDPGSVPESEVWKRGGDRSSLVTTATDIRQYEVKADGKRRFCKWCDQYKPDRCHHCRVCRSCILRMDHHCPWIANCVGFGNHKYFFLLVVYALINTVFTIGTMQESVARSIFEECSPKKRFLIIFATTLATIMMLLLALFSTFHTMLMLKATTTIEFCEKQSRADGEVAVSYDLGAMKNVKAVLGDNVFLWFLPICPPTGDGLSFERKAGERHGQLGMGGGSAACLLKDARTASEPMAEPGTSMVMSSSSARM